MRQLPDYEFTPRPTKSICGQIDHPRQQTAADHELEELGDEFFQPSARCLRLA
jgi:hypothetical protein